MSKRDARASDIGWIATVIVLGLGGCSLVPAGQPVAAKSYLLEWSGPLTVSPSPPADPCLTLLVSDPTAASGFDTSAMAYVEQPHRLDYFADHRWVDAPARMLGPLLQRALDTSGLFRAVVVAPTPVAANLRLNSELLRLQQVFANGHSAIELGVHAELIDLSRRALVADHFFSVREPAPRDDPYGGVIAANRAVNELFSQLASFLSRQIAGGSLQCRG